MLMFALTRCDLIAGYAVSNRLPRAVSTGYRSCAGYSMCR